MAHSGKKLVFGTTSDWPEGETTLHLPPAARGNNAVDLVLEWENTRVRIPITRG